MPRGVRWSGPSRIKQDEARAAATAPDDEEQVDDWLERFQAFHPRRGSSIPQRSSASLSPSGTISLSSDLGIRFVPEHAEDSTNEKGWVCLFYEPKKKQVAIVVQPDGGVDAVRITRTRGQRYAINGKSFLTTYDIMPSQRVTVSAQWRTGVRDGVVFNLPY